MRTQKAHIKNFNCLSDENFETLSGYEKLKTGLQKKSQYRKYEIFSFMMRRLFFKICV